MAGRVFNALTGAELKKIILAEIEKELSRDERFAPHLAFPVVEWTWQLAIDAYPVAEPHMEVQVKGKVGTEEAVEKARKAGIVERFLTKAERKVNPEGQAPDEVRAEAGLPVTVPTPTSAGATFDMMESPQRKP